MARPTISEVLGWRTEETENLGTLETEALLLVLIKLFVGLGDDILALGSSVSGSVVQKTSVSFTNEVSVTVNHGKGTAQMIQVFCDGAWVTTQVSQDAPFNEFTVSFNSPKSGYILYL